MIIFLLSQLVCTLITAVQLSLVPSHCQWLVNILNVGIQLISCGIHCLFRPVSYLIVHSTQIESGAVLERSFSLLCHFTRCLVKKGCNLLQFIDHRDKSYNSNGKFITAIARHSMWIVDQYILENLYNVYCVYNI